MSDTILYFIFIMSRDERKRVTVRKPLPTGRQAFWLELEGYVKLLRPAFAEAAPRRQANNVTE
jgi:hypothetical protein